MATYYVKTGGSDSNTGLDDANAWAHHPWMSTWTGSVTLAAGDTVCMNKGNTWTIASPVAAYMTVGQSGSVGNYITTTSYGTGVKPIINISTETEYQVIEAVTKSFLVFDNLDISHWDEAQDIGAIGGFTAITLGTTCHDVLITNCDIHNCPSFGISVGVDGYNITVGDISATTTATTVSYSNHIYDIGYSAISMSGCDPSTEISNYKVYYNYIHDVYAEGTDGSNAYGVSFSSAVSATNATNYTYVKYNYIKDIPAWTGVDNHNGLNAYIQDNYISNCKYGYSSQITTPGGSWSGVLTNLYLERNTFENSTDHFASDYFFSKITGTSAVHATNITLKDNTYFYTSRPAGETNTYGFSLSYADNATIEGNYFYNGPIGYGQAALKLVDNLNNIVVKNNFIHNWTPSISMNPDAIEGTISIYNNIIRAHGLSISCENAGTVAGNLLIYNNTFLVTPTDAYDIPLRLNITTLPVSTSVKVKNNIIGFSTASPYYYIRTPITISGTFECDYNLYWNSSTAEPFILSGDDNTFTEWEVHGYDTNSPNTDESEDPLFTNLTASYSLDGDFRLTASSPCLNAGTDVDVDIDYANNARSGNPDIGAFEYLTSFGFGAGLIRF